MFKKPLILSIVLFLFISMNTLADVKPTQEMVFNNSDSTLCYHSGEGWSVHDVEPHQGAFTYNPSEKTAYVTYNVQIGIKGDCSENSRFMGDISLAFEDGKIVYEKLEPINGYLFFVESAPLDECHEGGTQGLNCFMFTMKHKA